MSIEIFLDTNIFESARFCKKKRLNSKNGQDLFFIDYVDKSDSYYILLNAKMEEYKEKSNVHNKYLWLLRYYHLKFSSDYTLDPAFQKIIL